MDNFFPSSFCDLANFLVTLQAGFVLANTCLLFSHLFLGPGTSRFCFRLCRFRSSNPSSIVPTSTSSRKHHLITCTLSISNKKLACGDPVQETGLDNHEHFHLYVQDSRAHHCTLLQHNIRFRIHMPSCICINF